MSEVNPAIALLDLEIQKLQADQDVHRAAVAALDAPIAALVRVRRQLEGDVPAAPPEKGQRRSRQDEPTTERPALSHFPGTEIPVRTAEDQADAQAMLDRLEAQGL